MVNIQRGKGARGGEEEEERERESEETKGKAKKGVCVCVRARAQDGVCGGDTTWDTRRDNDVVTRSRRLTLQQSLARSPAPRGTVAGAVSAWQRGL